MITYRHASWGEAKDALREAFSDEGEYCALVALWLAGRGEAFAAMAGDTVAAYAVIGANDVAVTIYALSGDGAPGLIDATHAFAAEIAKLAGVGEVRAFAARPGMLRHMARRGWTEVGRLMSCRVA